MKLVILYSSRGARGHSVWDKTKESKSSIGVQYTTDGYAYLADKLIERGVVDEVVSFVEVGRHHGSIKINDKHTVYAIPTISCISEFVKSGDILFIRGCWKHWADILHKLCKTNWEIYYGAGTPRSNWGCWHVVMYDFLDKAAMGRHHPKVPFIKPINYDVFYPINCKKEYDILLNSCFHIYDKKGQYKFINACVEYKKMYGKNLSVALPGGSYRNTYTSKMPTVIKSNDLNIYQPGTLSRQDLNVLINKCKLFIHLGYGEQNARSALEAMRCGLPLYIASPHLWPKHVSAHPNITRLCKNPNDYKTVAQDIHQILKDIDDKKFGTKCTKYFDDVNSPELTVNQFKKLIDVMKKYPVPDQKLLTDLGI